jgi:formate hydrogenlyase transcriptional activator
MVMATARAQDEGSVQELSSLLPEICHAIAAHDNLGDLFHALAKCLRPIVAFNFLSVVLHDPDREVMRMYVLEGEVSSSILRTGMEFPMEDSVSAFSMRNARPTIIPDTETEPRFKTTTRMLSDHGVRSLCSLPLITPRRRLGGLTFGNSTKGTFLAEDLTALQMVADQVAVAVENALNFEATQKLQEELGRERDRLKLLLDVNNAVVSQLDLPQVFRSIPTSVRKAMQCDAACLALPEPEKQELRIHGLDISESRGFFREQMTFPISGSSAGKAYETGKPFFFGTPPTDLAPISLQSNAIEGFNSGCFIPIVHHGRKLGVLLLLDRRKDAFRHSDVEFLEQIVDQVAIALENALSYQELSDSRERLAKERLYLLSEIRSEHRFDEIVGSSSGLRGVLHQIETVAPTDSTVLIEGETGTGKEVIARTIHNLSSRRDRTFVKVNCAAIPAGLLESELFGHERGAFTGALAQKIGRFELAHKGTLFLDEIGDLPLELQPKLLRVLQEQEFERLGSTRSIRVDTRIIAATNRDLGKMVEEREFRADLYYRFNVFPVTLPPLRERREDIPALVRYFASQYSERMKKPIKTVPSTAMDVLVNYDWPGNIRELQNFIERAVILSSDTVLRPPLAELKNPIGLSAMQNGNGNGHGSLLQDAEREHIVRILKEADWVLGGNNGAAAKLGVPRTTLLYKMRRLGIPRQQSQP